MKTLVLLLIALVLTGCGGPLEPGAVEVVRIDAFDLVAGQGRREGIAPIDIPSGARAITGVRMQARLTGTGTYITADVGVLTPDGEFSFPIFISDSTTEGCTPCSRAERMVVSFTGPSDWQVADDPYQTTLAIDATYSSDMGVLHPASNFVIWVTTDDPTAEFAWVEVDFIG